MGKITASLYTDCNAPTEREQLMEKDRKITEAMTMNRKNSIFFTSSRVCVHVCEKEGNGELEKNWLISRKVKAEGAWG